MKLYIAGPMSGIEEHNFPAFYLAEAQLREAGYRVVNPASVNQIGTPWTDCLKKDLKKLLDCDGLALLPGWEHSRGATLEHDVAERLEYPIHTVIEWLGKAHATRQRKP